MGPLAAFLFVTPVFGLSLHVDPSYLAAGQAAASSPTVAAAESGAELDLEFSHDLIADTDAGSSGSSMADEIARRRRLGRIHRGFGIATWVGMTAATVFGIIQYRNLYGGFDNLANTPCTRGDATFGQGACSGLPAPHLATVVLTSALYYTTFGLSYAMPDPLHVDQGDGSYARRLRTHKRLRWVHFAGMAAQILLGMITANSEAFGLSRAEDFRTLQALGTVHLAIGLATWGTLTYAGALMVR